MLTRLGFCSKRGLVTSFRPKVTSRVFVTSAFPLISLPLWPMIMKERLLHTVSLHAAAVAVAVVPVAVQLALCRRQSDVRRHSTSCDQHRGQRRMLLPLTLSVCSQTLASQVDLAETRGQLERRSHVQAARHSSQWTGRVYLHGHAPALNHRALVFASQMISHKRRCIFPPSRRCRVFTRCLEDQFFNGIVSRLSNLPPTLVTWMVPYLLLWSMSHGRLVGGNISTSIPWLRPCSIGYEPTLLRFSPHSSGSGPLHCKLRLPRGMMVSTCTGPAFHSRRAADHHLPLGHRLLLRLRDPCP